MKTKINKVKSLVIKQRNLLNAILMESAIDNKKKIGGIHSYLHAVGLTQVGEHFESTPERQFDRITQYIDSCPPTEDEMIIRDEFWDFVEPSNEYKINRSIDMLREFRGPFPVDLMSEDGWREVMGRKMKIDDLRINEGRIGHAVFNEMLELYGLLPHEFVVLDVTHKDEMTNEYISLFPTINDIANTRTNTTVPATV